MFVALVHQVSYNFEAVRLMIAKFCHKRKQLVNFHNIKYSMTIWPMIPLYYQLLIFCLSSSIQMSHSQLFTCSSQDPTTHFHPRRSVSWHLQYRHVEVFCKDSVKNHQKKNDTTWHLILYTGFWTKKFPHIVDGNHSCVCFPKRVGCP